MPIAQALIIFLLAPAGPSDAAPASFNCLKASTSSERRVCDNGYLGFLDQKLARLYKDSLARTPKPRRDALRNAQKAWLAVREACASDDCLIAAYDARIQELEPEAEDLAVYRNAQYGFELRYPKTMKVTTKAVTHYHVNARWQQKASSDEAPIVSVVVYRPNGEAEYPDVEVRVGAHAGKTPEAACERQADRKNLDLLRDGTLALGGQKFEVFDIGDAGMSQSIDGYSYQAFRDGTCFAIEGFVTDSSLVGEGRRDAAKARAAARVTQSYYLKTYEIVRSFRFLGS